MNQQIYSTIQDFELKYAAENSKLLENIQNSEQVIKDNQERFKKLQEVSEIFKLGLSNSGFAEENNLV